MNLALPFPLKVALRYIVAKPEERFVSLLAWLAICGIFLGVTALIVVLSVMDGFDDALRDKLLVFTPHVVIQQNNSDILKNWQAVKDKVISAKNLNQNQYQYQYKYLSAIESAWPLLNSEAIIRANNLAGYLKIHGVLADKINNLFNLENKIIAGSLKDLANTSFGIILNTQMADSLGVNVGDEVKLVSPNLQFSIIGLSLRSKLFKVVGIFDTKYKSDADIAFVNLSDAQKFFKFDNNVSYLALRLDNLFAAQNISQELLDILGKNYQIKTWMELNSDFFSALALEKTIMFIILLLIVAVATFNILSILIMTVTQKYREVAILRTVGATKKQIMAIFVFQGVILGAIGIICGFIFGVLIAKNVSYIDEWLQKFLHIKLFASQAFLLNYLPSKISWIDIFKIVIAAFGLNILATIYPAWRATQINPAEALHYEK